MKIQIDGVDHELDVQAAAKAGCLKQVVVHRAGNRYIASNSNQYILASIERNKYSLINLKSGNRYNDSAIYCKPNETITEEMFLKYTESGGSEIRCISE